MFHLSIYIAKEPTEVELDSGDKFYYVSILKSLERLLNDEGVVAEVNVLIIIVCCL